MHWLAEPGGIAASRLTRSPLRSRAAPLFFPVRFRREACELMATSITLKSLTWRLSAAPILSDISFTVEPGELFFLLGPSGCGKTSILRMIAGFLQPTSGRVFFGDRDVTHATPRNRRIGMVFQGYALWPHLSVIQNVSFGLSAGQMVRRRERRALAMRALETVQLENLANRKPGQLSGGQQQRVALARAIAMRPDALLLDEPLSHLDAKLRKEMGSEIRRLCKSIGVTTVYVTHDQGEALSMSDRVAVMRRGRVEHLDTPQSAYTHPPNRFVAEFLGETNLVPGTVRTVRGTLLGIDTPIGQIEAQSQGMKLLDGDSTLCSFRPESLRIGSADGDRGTVLCGMCIEARWSGPTIEAVVQIANSTVCVRAPTSSGRILAEGSAVDLFLPSDEVTILDPDQESDRAERSRITQRGSSSSGDPAHES